MTWPLSLIVKTSSVPCHSCHCCLLTLNDITYWLFALVQWVTCTASVAIVLCWCFPFGSSHSWTAIALQWSMTRSGWTQAQDIIFGSHPFQLSFHIYFNCLSWTHLLSPVTFRPLIFRLGTEFLQQFRGSFMPSSPYSALHPCLSPLLLWLLCFTLSPNKNPLLTKSHRWDKLHVIK